MTLLDKALEAKVSARQKKGAATEELELAVAYWKDHVSAAQVAVALGSKSKNATSAIDSWAKKVLRAGLADGRISLTVESQEDEEFDKRHAEAMAGKAAPAPVKAVGR